MKTTPWRNLYEAAMLELNSAELRRKIALAEEAIRQRGDALTQTSDPNTREEQKAIADALRNLRVLTELESKLDAAPMRTAHQPATYGEAL